MAKSSVFSTSAPWDSNRPHILVVACSDGRLQLPLDEFLNDALGIARYDRVYLPGGPGALSSSGVEFTRASRMTEELKFLIEAHKIEQVILVYHGPAEDGPDEAICADYRRVYRFHNAEAIRRQQEQDTEQILCGPLGSFPSDKISAFRLEVTGSHAIEVRRLR